eukprot:1470247-Amphidinium_carterae.1
MFSWVLLLGFDKLVGLDAFLVRANIGSVGRWCAPSIAATAGIQMPCHYPRTVGSLVATGFECSIVRMNTLMEAMCGCVSCNGSRGENEEDHWFLERVRASILPVTVAILSQVGTRLEFCCGSRASPRIVVIPSQSCEACGWGIG